MPASGHNTLQCIATQNLSSQTLSCHDTIICIVTFTPYQIARPSFNTIWCPAIQFPSPLHTQDYSAVTIQQLYRDTLSLPANLHNLHTQRPCHDTIFHCIVTLFWAVAQISSCIFFSFCHTFFSLLHFCYWKHPKNTYPFFFSSFSSAPNKFIKIYFHSFFFNFTPCKTLENNFLHLIFFSFIF